MIWLIISIVYGLGGIWMFQGTYRDARNKEERKPLHEQRTAWKDALECALSALFWPVAVVLVMTMVFILWLGFRQDKM